MDRIVVELKKSLAIASLSNQDFITQVEVIVFAENFD